MFLDTLKLFKIAAEKNEFNIVEFSYRRRLTPKELEIRYEMISVIIILNN